MSISLSRLEKKKLGLGIRKLSGAGIDVERWLAMCNADEGTMKQLTSAWPVRFTSFTYDAVAILGFGQTSAEPFPEPAPGEIVIRVGDWSLQNLRDCEVGKELMHQQDWYDKYDFASAKLTPGIYRVRLPVPDSNRKNFTEQKDFLLSGEEVAPVALGASALLVHLKKTSNDLLKNDWCRCAEPLPDDDHVALNVRVGRVGVDFCWGGYRNGNLTSQLFANVYLNELDQFMKHKLHVSHYIRYTDDFAIVSDNYEELEHLIGFISSFINEKLFLELHLHKVTIRKYGQGIDFLGYVLLPHHRVLRTKTKHRMYRRMREKISMYKTGNITLESVEQSLYSYLVLVFFRMPIAMS